MKEHTLETKNCIKLNSKGEPCGNVGLERFGDMCYPHYKQSKGQDPEKILVRFVKMYKTGAILNEKVRAGVIFGDMVELTPQEVKLILDDDSQCLEIL